MTNKCRCDIQDKVNCSLSKVYTCQEINPKVLHSPSIGYECQALIIARIVEMCHRQKINYRGYDIKA